MKNFVLDFLAGCYFWLLFIPSVILLVILSFLSIGLGFYMLYLGVRYAFGI